MAQKASSTSSSRRFRVIVAAMIAAAVTVGVVGAKFAFSYGLAPSSAGIGGLRDITNVDYLLIGSSHTRQGYSAEIIEAQTRRSAYVLAYNGLDAVYMHELLEHLINERHLRIGRLVIEAYSIN